MYGRLTSVGYQNSTFRSVTPDSREQLLGHGRVVRVLLDRVAPAEQLRRHELGRDLGALRVLGAEEVLLVDRVRDGLADVGVVQRRDRGVEADVADVERRPLQDREAGLGERVGVGRVDQVVAVDLAGLERLCGALGRRRSRVKISVSMLGWFSPQ